MFTKYVEVRDWLEGFIPLVYGKEELGLSRIENLLEKLGNPQNKFKSIHVGGTSGKGSTAYYIARLLQFSENSDNSENQKTRRNLKVGKSDKSESLKVRSTEYSEFSGLKIGLHVSPHLIYVGERMQINGENIPAKRLIELANEIKPVIDDIATKQPQLLPSYFEILVALAFLYFAKEKVDYAVVEVGLGGKLDATNVLGPEISVITNVGLDHTEILGDTVEKIAKEKAGIIKEKVPIVTGAIGKALEVIEKVVLDKNSALIKLNTQNNIIVSKTDAFGYVNEPYYTLRSQSTSFVSKNQNLALAVVLSLGINLDKKTVRKTLNRGYIGRFEHISDMVVVDGAHNADKVKALVLMVKSQFPDAKISLVLAFKSGKNWKEMVDILFKNLAIKSVCATQYFASTDMGKGSAVKPTEIKKYIETTKQRDNETTCVRNSQEAVFEAVSHKSKNDLVLVTGSLYLVGEVRTLWQLLPF